jgi:hypothetical protein
MVQLKISKFMVQSLGFKVHGYELRICRVRYVGSKRQGFKVLDVRFWIEDLQFEEYEYR